MLSFLLETTNPLEKDPSNAAAIAGGVIGACVVLFVVVGILFLRYHVDNIIRCLTNDAYSNYINWRKGNCDKCKIIFEMK